MIGRTEREGRMTAPINYEILSAIDRAIKTVWLNNIQADWQNDALLREDSLKCAFYYHLRRKLANLLRKNNLRIFSEYRFAALNLKADLVIVKLHDNWKNADFLADAVSGVIAVIELKYTGDASRRMEETIKGDVRKFKRYLQEGNIDCLYYLGVIYEAECLRLNWMDKRATNAWAGGRTAELDAGYMDGRIKFEVHSYKDLSRNKIQHLEIKVMIG